MCVWVCLKIKNGGMLAPSEDLGLGHPATGAWKVCPRCRVVFRNLSASDVRPPADGRGMPVRTGREERGYGHTDGGARADGVSGMVTA